MNNEKMQKHRVIVGWLFIAVAMLIAVFATFTWKKAFGDAGLLHDQRVIEYAIAVALLFTAVGLTLLFNYRHAAWICLPFSVVILVYFPIGTAVGGYYLWYYWRFIYNKDRPQG